MAKKLTFILLVALLFASPTQARVIGPDLCYERGETCIVTTGAYCFGGDAPRVAIVFAGQEYQSTGRVIPDAEFDWVGLVLPDGSRCWVGSWAFE